MSIRKYFRLSMTLGICSWLGVFLACESTQTSDSYTKESENPNMREFSKTERSRSLLHQIRRQNQIRRQRSRKALLKKKT